MIESTPHVVTPFGAEILFKHEDDVSDYVLHASAPLKLVLIELAEWSKAHGLPPPVVTCGGRKPEENEVLPDHAEHSLHLYDALGLFWAVDLRIFHYTTEQLQAVLHHLDVIHATSGDKVSYVHNLNHGTAPHIHVGVSQ